MHCWSNSWSCCRVTNCKVRKLCFNNPWQSINLVRIWLYYWCEKKCEVQSLFWERTLEISFSYWQIKQSYKRNRKWNLLNVDKRQTLRYDHLWNWKDCVIKAGYSFLCNSVHLWTFPFSFTLVTISFSPQTGELNLRDGTITTGRNSSVGTTWQRERKLVTISWYTEIYF